VPIIILLLAAPAARGGVSMGTIEEDPQVTRDKYKKKIEEDYREGMKARASGDIETAVRLLLRCAQNGGMRTGSEYPEMAFNELTVIVEQARKELDVARQFISGEDPAAGMAELKRIMRTYSGLGPAKDAGTFLRQLESDQNFQATLKAGRLAEDLKKAEALEAQAEAILHPPAPEKPAAEGDPAKPPLPGATETKTPAAAGAAETKPLAVAGATETKPPAAAGATETKPPLPGATETKTDSPPPAAPPKTATAPAAPAPPKPEGVIAANVTTKPMTAAERRAAYLERLQEVYDAYGRIAQQGGDTEPGKKAAAARVRLEKDADLMARLKTAQGDRKAREYMGLAEAYFRAGRMDLARQQCQKILAEFPQSPQAAAAKDLLDHIK
jgi:tetratricopeptide (TPR) repeat protein